MPFPVARAGRYVNQPTGSRAFTPGPLPPDSPLITVNLVKSRASVSFATANKLVEQFRLFEETTGGQRNRRYMYTPYVALFEEEEAPLGPAVPVQTTEIAQ